MKNDQPQFGIQYALTGTKDDKCILNGNSWEESRVNIPLSSLPSASAHTPAPWFAQVKQVVSSTGRVIASTANIATGEAKGMNLEEKILFDRENIANARLIAAAPDLLAACKRALLGAHNESDAPILRAAIAKAEGK